MNRDEIYLAEPNKIDHNIRQTGKMEHNMAHVLFVLTPTKIAIMLPADPKAADRAKRYIWSRTERNQPDDWRAE